MKCEHDWITVGDWFEWCKRCGALKTHYFDLPKEIIEFPKQKCINADKTIGTCIERCIVDHLKAGDDVDSVFKDYGIKRNNNV